jgi:hypothetical protein
MKHIVVSLMLVLVVASAHAQLSMDSDQNLVSQRAKLRLMPVYQRWTLANSTFSQASSVLTWYQPLSSEASLSLQSAYGSVSGDVTTLRGLADIQLSGMYYIESADLVFNVGIGIPSGKKKLTFNEFLTSALISSNTLRPLIPNFGTGVSLSPSIAWALPLSDEVVVGLGAMFLYRGEFSPLADTMRYDPGDEVSFTGGIDLQLGEAASLSSDVQYSLYGTDKSSGTDLLTPGSKLLATLQFQQFFDADRLVFLLTFRTRAKAEFSNLVPQLAARTEPNQVELVGAYAVQFSKSFAMQFLLEGRFFQTNATPLSGFDLVGVGITPEFKLSETVSLPLQLKFVYGSSAATGTLRQIEAGLGVAINY